MHFYYFSTLFTSDFTASSVSSLGFLSPIQELEPGATPLPWWAVCCRYPHGLQQP